MINLLKFNGKLISNGLAAMSLDCKYSKLPGNMFLLLSIRTKHRGRRKKARESQTEEIYVCGKSLCHGKCKALVTVKEFAHTGRLLVNMPHVHLLHCNSVQHESQCITALHRLLEHIRLSMISPFLYVHFQSSRWVFRLGKTQPQTTNKTKLLAIE